MRKYAILLIFAVLAAAVLGGCRANVPEGTTAPSTSAPTTQATEPSQTEPSQTQPGPSEPTAGQTGSTGILEKIWEEYAAGERFAAYGGTVEHAVSDAPGDLDVNNTEELTNKYLIPEDLQPQVKEAASLVHMMNSNIFTGAVVKLSDEAEEEAFAKSWRDMIKQNHWICGQPDRLLIADLGDDHLLMVFGSKEAVDLFEEKLAAVYPDADMLYEDAIVS